MEVVYEVGSRGLMAEWRKRVYGELYAGLIREGVGAIKKDWWGRMGVWWSCPFGIV